MDSQTQWLTWQDLECQISTRDLTTLKVSSRTMLILTNTDLLQPSAMEEEAVKASEEGSIFEDVDVEATTQAVETGKIGFSVSCVAKLDTW